MAFDALGGYADMSRGSRFAAAPARRAPYRAVFISDLHLGDGTRSDSFLGKDRELIRLLERVQDRIAAPATGSAGPSALAA